MLRTDRSQHRAQRSAFTLVELLVVVMIICILATITLFALFNAGEAAKKGRTRAQIAKINDLLMPVWESYLTRRVPKDIPAGTTPSAAALTRLNGLRELMRLELPDRFSDVMLSGGGKVALQTINSRPALYEAYHRMATAASWHTKTAGAIHTKNQGSECLYMILSRMQDGESNGLEHFHATEIADTDGDGMREIVDAWGTPIRFLRWAPGFLAPYSALQNGTDRDPLDMQNVQPAAYMLVPLVMSAGPDMQWDIAFDGTTAIDYSTPNPMDPYNKNTPKIGSPDDNNSNNGGTPKEHFDNIHNHLLDISIK